MFLMHCDASLHGNEECQACAGPSLIEDDLVLRQTLAAVANTYIQPACRNNSLWKTNQNQKKKEEQQIGRDSRRSSYVTHRFLELGGRSICLHVETRQGQEFAAHRKKRGNLPRASSSWPSMPFQWMSAIPDSPVSLRDPWP